jgi:hypothetical protein
LLGFLAKTVLKYSIANERDSIAPEMLSFFGDFLTLQKFSPTINLKMRNNVSQKLFFKQW